MKRVEAILLARALVMFALFPALAGCLVDDEPLDRADRPEPAGAPEERVVPWASPEEATIVPGSMLRTQERDCPIHFLFTKPETAAVFLGTTAYCVRDLPLGAMAAAGDGSDIAILIYSSAQTMAEIGEKDPNALEYNDLAVFHLDRESHHRANPTLPGGGAKGLADAKSIAVGDRLRAFAPGENVPAPLAWREGVVGGSAGEWAFLTYAVLPGAPGTLGGPVIDTEGNAVGIFATLGVFPNPGANGVARLDTMLEYAATHARLSITLATEHIPMASTKS